MATINAFLNEATMEQSYEKYMSHWNKPSVRLKWNDRKPSFKRWAKAYEDLYTERQNSLLELQESQTPAPLSNSTVQEIIAAATAAAIARVFGNTDEPDDEDENDDEDNDNEDDLDNIVETEQQQEILGRKAQALKVEAAKRVVKPENANLVPNAGMLMLLAHRAQESKATLLIAPAKRLNCSLYIGSIDTEGTAYHEAAIEALVEAYRTSKVDRTIIQAAVKRINGIA